MFGRRWSFSVSFETFRWKFTGRRGLLQYECPEKIHCSPVKIIINCNYYSKRNYEHFDARQLLLILFKIAHILIIIQ